MGWNVYREGNTMLTLVTCPHCSSQVEAPAEADGAVPCSVCGADFTVPRPVSAPPRLSRKKDRFPFGWMLLCLVVPVIAVIGFVFAALGATIKDVTGVAVTGGMFGALFLLGVILMVMWTILPIIIYVYLRRLDRKAAEACRLLSEMAAPKESALGKYRP